MTTIEAVRMAFDTAFRDYCSRFGVRTVAFWRLGLADEHAHDADELREGLGCALLDDEFSECHMPAFLLCIQTQAAGHSYRLWEETVIPLLAGLGPDRAVRLAALRERFAGERPFRAALRSWLHSHGRSGHYTREGYHFWFVRAVIGECALVWVSSDFTEQFLDGMFSEWARTADARDLAERRFDYLLKTFGGRGDVGDEEINSIAVLRECMVEAGVRLAAIARLMRGQLPPSEGWTVDSLLDRARNLLGISLSGLPAAIIKVLRKRIELGIAAYSLDQLLGLFRRHPEAVLQFPGGTWSLRTGRPPPVAQGTLRLGDGITRQVVLLDDLGRGPEDVLGALAGAGDGWQAHEGVRWRISRTPFRVAHPSRLRAEARPVLGRNTPLATPDAWVWTGPVADEIATSGPGKHAGRGSPGTVAQGSTGPGRLRLLAWPSLDRDLHPVFFVLRFRIWDGENRRTVLRCEAPDGCVDDLWSDVSTSGWIDLRRRAPATAGGRTRFLLEQTVGGARLLVEEVSLRWPCPALFAAGRRVAPGQHLLPREGRMLLVSSERPEVTGGRHQELTSPHPSLSQARLYEILPVGDREITVAAGGERWRFDPRLRPLVRLRLIPSSAEGADASRYAFSDPGIRVFFHTPPHLCLHVGFSADEKRLRSEAILDLLGPLELAVGGADEPLPAIRVPCASLRGAFASIPSPDGITLRLPFDSFAPLDLTEPGFDVRRIALDGWLEAEGSAGGAVGVSGHGERFVVLPYSDEILLPRSPGKAGGIRLEDPSGLHDPLELSEAFCDETPAEGQTRIEGIPLSVQFPFSALTLETRADVSLAGAWFWQKGWTLEDLVTYLTPPAPPCARVILPGGDPAARVLVEAGSTPEPAHLVVSAPMPGPVAGDLTLHALLPATLLHDPHAQGLWLASPFSFIRIEVGGSEVGRIALDLRPCATGFRVARQGDPTPAGGTTVELVIEIIPGFVAGQGLEVVAVRLDEAGTDRSGDRLPVPVAGEPLARQVLSCSVDLQEPGEYRLELRRGGDNVALHTLEVTARAPALPETNVSLDAFLESWPSGEPAFANVVLLYRFLRKVPEPWSEFSLYALIDRAREASRDRRSVLYRLIDMLLGYLDEPPRGVTRVELAQPDNVPAEILPDVGTVVLHLQFHTEEPLRVDLPEWETVLKRAAEDASRMPEERAWLQTLARAAGRLQGRGAAPVKTGSRRDESTVAQPYFPCRADFLLFLQGRTPTGLIARDTK